MKQDTASLSRQLRLLGNQAMRLAADVAAREAGESPAAGERSVFRALEHDSDAWLLVAEDIYQHRQRRREFFGEDLFGEPAWDMLLDLYIAEKKNKRVSVTAACIGANCPGTTALRWLQQLEERGLVLREADPKDARRSFVRLSEQGYARMTDYLRVNSASMARERGQSQGAPSGAEAVDVSMAAQLIDAAAVFNLERRAA
jgi:DNA-binding MarR family transcriptional regulator